MEEWTVSDHITAESTLRVIAKEIVAQGIVAITLDHPDGRRLPDWAPGAHIDVVLPNGLTRQYSLCGNRWDAHTYRIAVLHEPDSRGGSAYIHESLTTGAHVGIGGPRNNFPMVPSERYLFVAGGIGITPMLPMIHQADLIGADWQLLYGGRTRATMAFQDDLAHHGDRVTVRPQDEYGRLDLTIATTAADNGAKVYACGPAPLLDALADLGSSWPRGTLRTERFVARNHGAPVRNTSFVVELARTNRTVTVTPDTSVLDAVRSAGAGVLSSCREGTCGTCETAVLAGEPDHRDSVLDDTDRETGDCMLLCVSRSRTDRLVLDL